ncbi:hypothetical protein [Paracoccus aminophilus]|nr:hypothetical protein [Paracoccus aminophilus]
MADQSTIATPPDAMILRETMLSEDAEAGVPLALSELFLKPRGPIFWSFALVAWAAALAYFLHFGGWISRPAPQASDAAARRDWPDEDWIRTDPPERTALGDHIGFAQIDDEASMAARRVSAPHSSEQDVRPLESWSLLIGLAAAAVWPWVFPGHAVVGFLLAALMLATLLGAALARPSGPVPARTSTTLGILAGWAMVMTCAAFATLLERDLGTSGTLSALVALLICAVASANIQLHLGSPFGFSATVIWGLFGIALATMETDATIATAAALAITFVGVALVRVST